MPFATALSQHPDAAEATGEVVGRVLDQMGDTGIVPDLAVLFCSPGHRAAVEDIAGTVRSLVSPRVLIGATAGMVVGGPREVEDGPAISLWAATLPILPQPVQVTAARTPSGVAVQGLPITDLPEGGTLILLADPFSVPIDAVLEAVDAAGSGIRVVGGLASAAGGPGGNRLVLDGSVTSEGAVGVVLDPAVATTTIVSQGCRPVGDPMIVTRADGNVIAELAGKPALERIAELAGRAGAEDRALLSTGLHIGLAIDEHRPTFERGDFVIRAVLGADRATKSVVVGEAVDVGTTVQFQVRDAASASEDLHALLGPGLGREAGGGPGGGALLFTCNGRGSNMFDVPDHDARAVAEAIGADTVAGMSCAGELGPVGGRSFVHGFTASVVLFHDR